MNPLTVCAFALCSLGMIVCIKIFHPEMASLASAVSGVLIFAYTLTGLSPYLGFFGTLLKKGGAEPFYLLLIKSLAVALACQMSSEICRDCGENALASRVELAGKIGIIVLSLPTIKQLLQIVKDMLE